MTGIFKEEFSGLYCEPGVMVVAVCGPLGTKSLAYQKLNGVLIGP